MIEEILNSYGLALDYLRRLVADVPDEDMARQVHGAVNHPAWVIGHLIHSCQAIAGELGIAPWLPTDWATRFGTGSQPTSVRSNYPSKRELMASLADGRRRLAGRLAELGEAGMSELLPDERYRPIFPTIGHAVTHILTSHTAVHVGQLSVWRRVAGYAPLSEIFV